MTATSSRARSNASLPYPPASSNRRQPVAAATVPSNRRSNAFAALNDSDDESEQRPAAAAASSTASNRRQPAASAATSLAAAASSMASNRRQPAASAAPRAASAASLVALCTYDRDFPVLGAAVSIEQPFVPVVAAVPSGLHYVRRGRYSQPPTIPIAADVEARLGLYYQAVSGTCLRNLVFRTEMRNGVPVTQLNDYKCFPDQCGRNHLERDVKFCNNFVRYLRDNWAGGINYLSAFYSCGHESCNFWPCNLQSKATFAVAQATALAAQAAVAKAAHDAELASISTVADLSTLVRQENREAVCIVSAEKVAMRIAHPEMFEVWCLPKYWNLEESDFTRQFHTNYLSWNTTTHSLIDSSGAVDADDDEWARDVFEVEEEDTRSQYADYLAVELQRPMTQDMRVLGSNEAMTVARNNPVIFAEYLAMHWNGVPRLEVFVPVKSFHDWLNEHRIYADIYTLVQSGISWRAAKKVIDCIDANQPVEAEAFDWDAAEAVPLEAIAEHAVRCVAIDTSKQASLMDSLRSMTSLEATSTCEKEKVRIVKQETTKKFLVSDGPDFLTEGSSLFVDRDMQGRFAIYVKLGKNFLQGDLQNISEIWSKFRVGAGRASFVTADNDMFLCISGSIKRVSGFREMFEKFPGFIAALRKGQFVSEGNLYVTPVHSTGTNSYPGNELQLTFVEQESDSDEEEDIGFAFGSSSTEEESFEVVRKGESDAYALCDILLQYFKK